MYHTRSHSPAARRPQRIYAPDRIGLVGFHDSAFVVARPAEPFAAWLQERSQKLHEKVAGTSTNLTDGIRTATRLLADAPRGTLRRMWLLTDGYPNRETGALDAVVAAARAAYVNINTIGFGDRYDEALLRRISAATHNGRFVSVQSLRELTKALTLGGDATWGPRRRHHRAETTILAIDCSPSMTEPMQGRTKIAVVEEAILHLLHYKQRCFA